MTEKNFLNELTDRVYEALGPLMNEDLHIAELRLILSRVVKEAQLINEPEVIKGLKLQLEAKDHVISKLQKHILDLRAHKDSGR